MSSLAAARADNFYYPPSWTPGQGSLNKLNNSHPLGDRAKRIGQGILTIRFEMPFNVWCTTCNSHIGKGVRYNADKKAVGKYFSTKIFEFTMACHLCFGRIAIQTDPEARDYKLVYGLRRKVETYSAEDAGSVELKDEKEVEKMRNDPFAKLENSQLDKQRSVESKNQITGLLNYADRMKDDYGVSQMLRKSFRAKRKEIQGRQVEAQSKCLNVTLLEHTEEERVASKLVNFAPKTNADQSRAIKRLKIRGESIFGAPTSSSSIGGGQLVPINSPLGSVVPDAARKRQEKLAVLEKGIKRRIQIRPASALS